VTSAPPATTAAVAKPATRILFAWQEMIDGNSRIAGYRIQPRAFSDSDNIDGGALEACLQQENARQFASRRPLLIPLTTSQWSATDFSAVIAANTCFLLTDLARQPEPRQWIDAIHAAGAKVAAYHGWSTDDKDGTADWPVDLLLFDFQEAPLAALEQRLRALRQRLPAVQLVADQVRTWPEHRLCQRLGFTFSIGGFAASRDEEAPSGKISESRLVVIDMLNQIRSDAELKDIASTAMRDPAVVVKLLDMANSPLYGLPRKVAGIEEAITLLGRDALYRWLSLAMFHIDADSDRDRTLLVIALCRGALLEGLVGNTDRQRADELFLVGLLSVIDCLLGQPMADILNRIRLPEQVAAVLLRNEGPYARYLQLAIMIERCRLDQAVVLAGAMQIAPAALIDCYREALGWASGELGK